MVFECLLFREREGQYRTCFNFMQMIALASLVLDQSRMSGSGTGH